MKYPPKKVYILEDGQYIELTYREFCERREADASYQDRHFIPVQKVLIETSAEAYKDFYRELERIQYLRKRDERVGLLSLEAFDSEGGDSENMIPDVDLDVAEAAVTGVMLDRLRECMHLLSDEELELVHALFYEELTEREYAKRKRVYHNAIHKRKARILAKLKKLMGI